MGEIVSVSPTEYEVEQKTVDYIKENMGMITNQARVVPSFSGGQQNGFRIYSIRPGSIYSKLGLRNGDVLQEINGMKLDSLRGAQDAYEKLQSATSLSASVLRGGRPMNINVSIR